MATGTMGRAKFDVIEWMAKNGHPEYRDQILALEATMNEVRGEAGRYGDQCEFTQHTLSLIRKQIAEIRQAATDRYEDWATD